MKKKSKLLIIFITIILMLSTIFMGSVFARDNTALSVGTIQGFLDTTAAGKSAAQAYFNAGYTSYYGTDLDSDRLWSFLYADVQFFSAHGASNRVEFKNSGIIVGNYAYSTVNGVKKEYIGTNAIHWDADTILVTYTSCYSAQDSSWDTIAGKTCERGANTVLGFNKEINVTSSTLWTQRYNEWLAQGSTVYEAAQYANSFIYVYPEVKTATIYGDSNLRIGKYRNTNTISGRKTIYSIGSPEIVATNENIMSVIKSNQENFNIDNYEILRNTGITRTETLNEQSENTEYIDIILKINDFYTDAGYTVYTQNGKIKEIYDNNIDIQKQEHLINSLTNSATTMNNNVEVESLKLDSIKKVKEQYNNELLIINENELSTKLYYNLITDKKYMLVEVPSKLDNGIDFSIAYDTVSYEI